MNAPRVLSYSTGRSQTSTGPSIRRMRSCELAINVQCILNVYGDCVHACLYRCMHVNLGMQVCVVDHTTTPMVSMVVLVVERLYGWLHSRGGVHCRSHTVLRRCTGSFQHYVPDTTIEWQRDGLVCWLACGRCVYGSLHGLCQQVYTEITRTSPSTVHGRARAPGLLIVAQNVCVGQT